MPARVMSLVLGAWLVVSTFLWPHGTAQRANTLVVGVLCVGFALLAMRRRQARYLNTALSIWLFVSAFALPVTSSWTIWNNALVAMTLFVTSLIGGGAREWAAGRPQEA